MTPSDAQGPMTPASHAFAAAALRSTKELREAMRGALIGRDPERVHRLRTTVRRIRALLRAFREEAPRGPRRSLDEALDRLADAAGGLRDLDVFAAAVAGSAAARAHPEAAERLARGMAGERKAPRARLRRHLLDRETRRLPAALARLAGGAARPGSPPLAVAGAARLPSTFEPVLARAARLSRGLGRADAKRLHALRLGVKKARYAAEAYAAAFGKPLARFAKAATALQDDLGALHDATVHGAAARGADAVLQSVARGSRAAGTVVEAPFLVAFASEQAARVEKIRERLDRRFEEAFGPRALARLLGHLLKRAARRAPSARTR